MRYGAGEFPMTEVACAMLLSLAMHAELTPLQVSYVAEAVREFHRSRGGDSGAA